jgi:hypothetical protein
MESMRLKDQQTVVEVEIYGKTFKGTRAEWNNGLYEEYEQHVRMARQMGWGEAYEVLERGREESKRARSAERG